MTVRVAVVDPLPMFTRGMVITLDESGYIAEAPDDVVRWVTGPGARVVILTVVDGEGWMLLAEILRKRPGVIVIVVADADPGAFVRAVSAGAVGVLPRDASAVHVNDVVRSAVGGHSVLPTELLRSLVADAVHVKPARLLSDDEIGWLRELAQGSTVARLAERIGYSERRTYRLLAEVYGRLGADSRTKALMIAQSEGWL
jgi:DNA-binding NarL/FixJ family response regulator